MCLFVKNHVTDAVVNISLNFSTEKGKIKQMKRSIKQMFVWRVLSVGVVLICFGTEPALGS